MVQEGAFTVQMVDVKTGKPFNEHSHSNGVYAEVEPGAQYWIRVQSALGHDEHRQCDVEVDEQDIGYSTFFSGKETHNFGIWSRDSEIETNTALQVNQLKGDSDMSFWIGSIKVDFFEVTPCGHEFIDCQDSASRWKGGFAPKACAKGKKAVRSLSGTETKTKPAENTQAIKYRLGPLVQTITLRYCTAPGLIDIGVLPKPPKPSWKHHHMLFEADPAQVDPELVKIKPEMKWFPTRVGSKVVRKTRCEEFDLTHLVDDDTAPKNESKKTSSSARKRAGRRREQPSRQAKRPLPQLDWDDGNDDKHDGNYDDNDCV